MIRPQHTTPQGQKKNENILNSMHCQLHSCTCNEVAGGEGWRCPSY